MKLVKLEMPEFVIGAERAATIRRQAAEKVAAMNGTFPERAAALAADIDRLIADIDRRVDLAKRAIMAAEQAMKTPKIASARETIETEKKNLDGLEEVRKSQEARRRTAKQLEEEERQGLYRSAHDILLTLYKARWARYLRHREGTCRVLDCDKQPRSGKARAGHKSARRHFVFCRKHSGVKKAIGKASYASLRADANLRVIVE